MSSHSWYSVLQAGPTVKSLNTEMDNPLFICKKTLLHRRKICLTKINKVQIHIGLTKPELFL
jgi:hypothetical protein